jgi:cytochrome P450
MDPFVDLGVSFFDEDFTLDPFPYLKDLYGRDDVLGFRADGMNFVFRFEQVREVLRSRHCRREPLANPEIEARERIYAERYPNRARNFALGYQTEDGGVEFGTKKLMMDFLDETARVADFSGVRSVFERLSAGGRIDDYIEAVQTLPLRVMLESCGLPHTEDELVELTQAGIDFIRGLDNFVDEAPLAASDAGLGRVWRYIEDRLPEAAPCARIRALFDDGSARGIPHDKLVTNVGSMVLIALSNTAGISSAYLLRNLIRYPDVRKALADDPDLVRRDDVITEFLRRDNHVKSLSRQVHADFELGGFSMRRGESIFLFFPGANLDPAQYPSPLRIDPSRRLTGADHVVFGGSTYICIGKKLGIEFLKKMLAGFLEHLPEGARIVEDEVEVDGSWVAERIITKMPIALGA